jgi:NAD+ synthase (glutamine-hydrolysing)
MKVFVAQINPIVGDIDGNTNKILHAIERAKLKKMDILITPELAICGYPPEDLLLFPNFIEKTEKSLERIRLETKGIFVVVGCVRKTKTKEKGLYNSAAVISDGKILGYKDKTFLVNEDVFNERRYFEPGEKQEVWKYKGKRIGVLICAEVWKCFKGEKEEANSDILREVKKLKPDIVLSLNASPYYFKKKDIRYEIGRKASKSLNCKLILCNQVGANDQLVFDGFSMYFDKGELKQIAKGFVEEDMICDLEKETIATIERDHIKDLYNALVLGVKDYFLKQGFQKALIGISGGIDSALTSCLAVDALGPQNVLGLRMPSRFSSLSGIEDAEDLSKNLRFELKDIPIDSIFQSFLNLLSPFFYGMPFDTAEENLQARIRGMVLMGVSNKLGYIVLSTGNKSEIAMGYVTLYGDMCGGLGVLNDVSKTLVYKLSNWINREREIIPKSIIDKIPSAELRKDQTDEEVVGDYAVLDLVLEEYVENHKSIDEIVEKHFISKEIVKDFVERIHISEYKRRQGPPGIRVTKKAFSKGRLFPIVQGWV